jgi:para-nitrobenzyl esterase
VNFVKTGNPNGAGLPNWPAYRSDAAPFLAIDAPAKVLYEADRARQEFLALASDARGQGG